MTQPTIAAAVRHPFWGLRERVERMRAEAVENTQPLLAERDRLQGALESIRERDWVENALDPQWPAGVAREALDPAWPRVAS